MQPIHACDYSVRETYASNTTSYANAIDNIAAKTSWSSSYDAIIFILPKNHSSSATSSDLNYPISKGFFKAHTIDLDEQVVANLRLALANEKAAAFSQKEAALQAATIFSSFRIKNILVQYTEDDSVMFEFIESGFYFLLEIFGNGEIAYLRREGRGEPFAYDISQRELYNTIESMYDTIVENNVQ